MLLLVALIALIVLIALTVLLFMNIKIQESYIDVPLLIYKTDLNPYVANIIYNSYNNSSVLQDKVSNIRNVTLNLSSPLSSPLYVTDALSFSLNTKNQKMLTTFDDEKIFIIVKPKDNNPNLSIVDVINDYTFGYLNDEPFILRILLRSLGLRTDLNIKTKKVGLDASKTINEQWFINNNINALLCFTSLTNQWFLKQFDKTFVMDILSYEDLNTDILKFYTPYIKMKSIDISPYLNIFKETNKIQFVISFDMLIYGDSTIENHQRLRSVLYTLVVNLGAVDMLNYYSMYFPIFNHTLRYMKKTNDLIATRDTRPILEQFTEAVDIETSKDIKGFYDSKSGQLFIDATTIDTFKLKKDMQVKLSNQERDEENGVYIVIHTESNKTILKKTSLTSKTEDPYNDPRYECYGQKDIKAAGLCESEYDQTGKSKKPVYQWDRRCEKNEECPFYQANKNYRNYFGGCVDGFCQFPLGSERASFRRVDSEFKAMCYNCKDMLNPFCCEDQKDKSKYPSLVSPDYAFPLDSYERWKQIDAHIK